VNLRKIAGALAVAGLLVGLVGNGVAASFVDQVFGQENINVGTFACIIVNPSDGTIAGDQKSVTYNAPAITSSAASNAPFEFTVKNTGSIDQLLSISVSDSGTLSVKFSDMPLAPASPVVLPAGSQQTFDTGIQWTTLDNTDLGSSGWFKWTVDCSEAGQVIFDNHPAVLPGNLPSLGFQATQTDEFGGAVTFAGTDRSAASATVTMSSWTCETGGWNTNDCASTPGATYSLPITFKIYNLGPSNTLGSVVATKTQVFDIPFRPSADNVNCTGGNAGKWYNGSSCFNGLAFNITFNFAGEALPNSAVLGISYNTTTWGYSPLGGGPNPSDSLNVAVYPGSGPAVPALVGSWVPDNDSVFWNTHTAANYSDGGAGGTGTFRRDTGWAGQLPAIQIVALP
jgi:hypothetical protein